VVLKTENVEVHVVPGVLTSFAAALNDTNIYPQNEWLFVVECPSMHLKTTYSTTHNRRKYNPPPQTDVCIEGTYILTTLVTKQKTAVSSSSNFNT
jgi:hypothetical protein